MKSKHLPQYVSAAEIGMGCMSKKSVWGSVRKEIALLKVQAVGDVHRCPGLLQRVVILGTKAERKPQHSPLCGITERNL